VYHVLILFAERAVRGAVLKSDQVSWERRNILLTDTRKTANRRVPIDSVLVHELSEQRQRIEKSEFVFPSYDREGKVVALVDVKIAFGRALKDVRILNFRFRDLES
jgi:hypothetical protein